MKKNLLLFFAFFALYALTAQRGSGWGDSAEFQHWALDFSAFICGPKFSNAHPVYVAFARLIGKCPLAEFLGGVFCVTLLSSFFGALAVALLRAITGRTALAVLFGLSQMLWWLSTVAEVQTMSLALTAAETLCLVRHLETDDDNRATAGRGAWLLPLLAALIGVHLLVHNFALLLVPVFLFFIIRNPAALLVFAVSVSPYIYFILTRGAADVLFGNYGGKVMGVLPVNWMETGFNLALASLSFVVPLMLAKWNRKNCDKRRESDHCRMPIFVLFAINFLFFIRYFVQDQAQFLLPTLFFTYLCLRKVEIRFTRAVALVLVQLLLPIMAYYAVLQLPVPEYRKARHPGRNDAKYFILPWHFDMNASDAVQKGEGK